MLSFFPRLFSLLEGQGRLSEELFAVQPTEQEHEQKWIVAPKF